MNFVLCVHYDIMKNEMINLNSINTQTKVRRLAYVKTLMTIFLKSSYYPINLFYKKIESEAGKQNDDLLKYINNKGFIEVSKTGNSSKPYIETFLALKLLFTQNNMYRISKYGRVFNILQNELDIKTDNYFLLTTYEKAFLLYFILEKDGLYLQLIIELIEEKKQISIKDTKEVFQDFILIKLEESMYSLDMSSKLKKDVLLRIKRIKNWENPKRYLEHIIEPRVNWLLDLGFLCEDNFQKNILVLSEKGLLFFKEIKTSFDVNKNFFTLIHRVYFDNTVVSLKKNDFALVTNYLEKSFILFKTSAPNRVTASQAILYTCYMMLFKENRIVNFSTIQDYLSSKENRKFIYDWYKTEQDGSIRRKR